MMRSETNKLVSVVVPVYNVEHYLPHCVLSVQEQSYTNLEIILVDDGSEDKSSAVCEELAKTDARITVIHQKNGGLSCARNAGIETARGEYIVFVDSDDWIEDNILEIAVSEIETRDTDLIIWGYAVDSVDEQEKLRASRTVSGSADLDAGEGYLTLHSVPFCNLRGYAWNKLYRRSIIEKYALRFPTGISLVEDTIFNASYFSHCRRISFIDAVGTHYMQRKRSTLGTKYYANGFMLKQKNTDYNLQIYAFFGAPASFLEAHRKYASFQDVKCFAKMVIDNPKKSKEERRLELVSFLQRDDVGNILKEYKPDCAKNRILKTLFTLRADGILFCIL